MPANYAIASELSYAVLLKQRTDPEVVQTHPPVIRIVVNKQLQELDQARPEDRFVGSRS